MATGEGRQRITFTSWPEELEYNGRLYKEIINPFTNCMPAALLKDYTCINAMLRPEQMEQIQRKHDNDGTNAAARLLLDCIRPKPGFFDALLEVMDCEELKLQEFKCKFMDMRAKVDAEWLKSHPRGGIATDVPQPASQDPEATVPKLLGAPCSDFQLMTPMQVANREDGMQIDAVHQGGLSRNHLVSEPQLCTQSDAHTPDDECRFHHSQSYPGNMQDQSGDNLYTDARSTPESDDTYDTLDNSRTEELPYTKLSNISLQTDASPSPMQVSEVLEQQMGEEALPRLQQQRQVRQQHRGPMDRRDHPSLRNAISRNPLKDFEAQDVIQPLRDLPGWIDHQEEQEVIQFIRPHRRHEGHYVFWYWALAKRPTICVVYTGKVITFVVHKSAAPENVRFYVNRNQKRCDSLRDLVKYHVTNGIEYHPPGEGSVIVPLTTPLR